MLINLSACFFLGLIFIGSFSMSPEAVNPLSEQQVLVRQIIYGVGVSLVFSLISLLIGAIFKRKLSFDGRYLKRIFIIQFFLLILVYTVVYFFIQLK